MKAQVEVNIVSYREVKTLEGSWSFDDYRKLLDLLGFGDVAGVADNELMEYLSMSLQELELDEAALEVLTYRLGHELNGNQISEISHEMIEEPLWEEYGNMALHEELFNVNSLLYHAFNGKFPRPKAALVELTITAKNQQAKEVLHHLNETVLCRVIAGGMSDHAILNRLFHEKLESGKFEEADDIVWTYDAKAEGACYTCHLTTSTYWVHELANAGTYQIEIEPREED